MSFRDTWQDELDDHERAEVAPTAHAEHHTPHATRGAGLLRAKRPAHLIMTMILCGPVGLLSLTKVDIFLSLTSLLAACYGLYLFGVMAWRAFELRPGQPGQAHVFHDVLEAGLYAGLISFSSGFWMGFAGVALTRGFDVVEMHMRHAMSFGGLSASSLWFTLLLGVPHIALTLDARRATS